MSKRALSLALLLACALGSLGAQEISSPQRPASNENRSEVKAPYLFNMRGRRDPFINPNAWQTSGSKAFDVTLLELKGIVEVNGAKAVLFVRATDKAVFTLRGQRLFGADGKAVPGVMGRALDKGRVQLRQGEQSLIFSAFRAAKRKF